MGGEKNCLNLEFAIPFSWKKITKYLLFDFFKRNIEFTEILL